ncbi:hypothetical protein TSOC_003224, partial [Tetrabaena socialis]
MPPATACSPPAASPSRLAAARRRPGPLSFSRWFARRANAADLPLLLLELLLINALYRSQQLFRRTCLPVGGGPHAALQELPLEPAAHRADALLAAFPCGASHAGRLLYVLRTAAAFDPRVALRLTDWGNAGYTFVQLLAVMVSLAAPWMYERPRHGLFVAVTAATFLGSIASALWTPDPLLPLVASTFIQQRPSTLYFMTHRLSAIKAALSFVAVAVLPYIVARIWEHVSLRPQYRAYLHRWGGASGGAFAIRASILLLRNRLELPPAALRAAGVLLLHLLPASTPPPPPQAQERGGVAASVVGRDEAAADANESSAGGPRVMRGQPFASLPLLVLPPAAAAEVRQLYGDPLGAMMQDALDVLLGAAAAVAADGGACVRLLAGGVDSAAAASSAAAIAASGLTGLVYDMGYLLQLPYGIVGVAAPPPDDLFSFLASRGMTACLRAGLQALRSAGQQHQQPPLLPPNQPAGPLWWLRVLLQGFSPPTLERSYQAFKAAQCRSLDRLALVLVVMLRLLALVPILRAVLAGTAAVPAPHGLGAGWLTMQQQELTSQAVFVGIGLAMVALAHRTNLFILKALLDAAAFLLVFWPEAWRWSGHLLLAIPDMWLRGARRTNVHYLYSSLWEPATLQPLSFSRWFARRAYAGDLLFLLLELLIVPAIYTAQQLFRRVCLPVGGGPHAALQELPLEPAAHRADALLAAFPCGASYAGRLLYVCRTLAAFDPRTGLRLADWGGAAYVAGQLLLLAVALVALAAPTLYERTRHGLFIVITAATVLGLWASAAWTPDALLPLVAGGMGLTARRRLSIMYFGWKAVARFRLYIGPATWMMLMAAVVTIVGRRTLPPDVSASHHLSFVEAALSFVAMAVLPYLVARPFPQVAERRGAAEAVVGRDGAAAGANESSAEGPSEGPRAMAGQPFASLPLLVLHPAAAAEVRQLYGDPLRGGLHVALDGLLGAAAAAAADGGACVRLLAGGSEGATAAASAAATIADSGLTGMVYDIGDLLQLPYGIAGVAAAPPDDLLSFLASHGMPACLRTGLQALRSAGVQLEAGALWWLRVLLLGFSPPGLERSYQAFKAAQCRSLDRLALVLLVVLRLSALVPNLRTVLSGTAAAPAPHGLGAGWLTIQQQQLISHAVFMGIGLAVVALAFGARLLQSPPAASPSRPAAELLSFSRWFARRAYAADIPLLLLELLTVNAFYRSQQLFSRMCLPVGGGPPAAMQGLPLEPAAHHADALLAAFPCRASYTGRLLYVLRTGAAVDPRVPLRLMDWGNAGYTLVRLLALAVALAAPWLYERTRHGLVIAVTAASFLGVIASALWTPDALLPLVASTFTLQRPSVLYFSWKAVTVFRVMRAVRGGAAEAVVGREEAAAGANESSAGGPRVMAGQPFASLPLLVLPPAAAAEVRQLYGDPLDAMMQDARDGLLGAAAAVAAGGGACVRLLAGGVDSAAAASSAAAIAARGLTGMVYDMGYLLQLPYGVAGVAAPPSDYLLSFLASHGMTACLRAGLQALRSAGVHLEGEEEAALLALAAARAGQPTAEGDAGLGALEAASSNAGAGSAPCMEAKRGEAQRTSAMRPAVCESPAGAEKEEADAGATAAGSGGRRMQQQQQPLLPPIRPDGPLWWLRVLALGFSPPTLERSYQAFKAAQCRSLDRLALGLSMVFRLLALVPILRAVLAGTVGTAAAPAPHGLGAGWLTVQQQELTSQAVFLGIGLAMVALAFGPRLLQRHRTNLFLFKAVLDAAAHLLMFWPEAWRWRGHLLLAIPEMWLRGARRTNVYYLYSSLWEPATLQLRVVLISLLPATLLAYHINLGRWAPALTFGACNVVCGMVVSAATDLPTRRAFLRQRNRNSVEGSHAAGSRPEPMKGPSGNAAAAPGPAAPSVPRGGSSSSHPKPLSFSRWLARRAYASDLIFLLLELLAVHVLHRSQQLFSRMCLPIGGGPHAALQELPLEPEAHRADALLAAFPCGASYAGRLLYVLRTGAAFDPRVALRFTDWGSLAHTVGQLLTLAVAMAAPRLYERTRHGLFVTTTAATLVGLRASAAWTVDGLLPLVASGLAARRGLSAIYFGCKAAAVFRIPSPLQFHVGILTWLLLLAGIATMNGRTPPDVSAPRRLSFVEAALFFAAVAVLPYMVARAWERVSLRPQYEAYLCSCGGRASGGGEAVPPATADGSSTAPAEPQPSSQPLKQPWPCCPARTLAAKTRGLAAGVEGASTASTAPACGRPGSPSTRRHAPAAGSRSGPGSGSGLGSGSGGDDTSATAARNVPAAPRSPRPAAAHADSTGPVALVSAAPPLSSPVVYRPSTLYRSGRAVSRGTVVLSVKVPLNHVEDSAARHRQFQKAVAAVLAAADSALHPYLDQATPGGASAAATAGVSGTGAGRTGGPHGVDGDGARTVWQLIRPASGLCVEGCVHLLLKVRWVQWGGDSWGGADGGSEATILQHATLQQAGAEEATGIDSHAVSSVVQRLLADARSYDTPSRTQQQPHGAFIWPPAVPLAAAVGAVEQGAGAGGADDSMRPAQQQLSTGTEVLVLLPAALLRGLGAVHLDVTVGAAAGGWRPAAEPRPVGGGYLQLRLGLPPAALRDAGALLLHLLPPPAGAGGAPAEGPDVLTGQPFATLPLLVLPSAAAEEVLQLYGDPLGGGWVRDTLDGLLGAATTAAADGGACCGLLAGGGMDAAAASAAAAIAVRGLTSLSYDLGDLMQLPYGVAGIAAAPPDPVVVLDRHLLSFLASHGMAACLRAGLQALRSEDEAALLAEAEAGGGHEEEGTEAEGGAGSDREEWAEHRPLAAAAEKNAATSSGAEQGELQRASAIRSGVCESPAGARNEDTPDADGATALAGGRTVEQPQHLPPSEPAGLLWWLRVLLLGFSPPALERSYQAFKAAQCRTLDCTALVLFAAAWVVLVNLLPSTLMGYYVNYNRWGPALAFGVGNALCGMAIAAITDLPTRRRFVRLQRSSGGGGGA